MTSWSVPSSVKPPAKAINTYRVPADNPKYIAIPAIDVGKTRTIQLGVLANGSIAVPDNIYDAGWYGASSKPGQNGAMFVYGHVSSWKANGIFYDLKKLKAGETVIVTNGANKVFTYRVINIKRYAYDKVDMGQVLAPVNPMMAGLNLMTCAGQIIKGTSEFSERLVVFTSLVSS
ncbi:MAG: Sortase family enzyme [Candidatus Saccharibacteria bacterium]|nr:Sortase family enzyme [Candidatus Saccharibacteria bacterium]